MRFDGVLRTEVLGERRSDELERISYTSTIEGTEEKWDSETLVEGEPKSDKSKLIGKTLSVFASVRLRVNRSHNPSEIACEIACNLMLFAECYLWIVRYAHWGVQEMRQSMRARNASISSGQL